MAGTKERRRFSLINVCSLFHPHCRPSDTRSLFWGQPWSYQASLIFANLMGSKIVMGDHYLLSFDCDSLGITNHPNLSGSFQICHWNPASLESSPSPADWDNQFPYLPWFCVRLNVFFEVLGVGKIPWRRPRQPALVFLPGQSHGQRSLEGYSPRVAKSRTRLSD